VKPPEVRRRAIDLLADERSVASVARELGCAQATIRAWRDSEPGLWRRRLERRIERLKRELAAAVALAAVADRPG
jgi:transposase-like protein